MAKVPVAVRFWRHVEKTEECWIWRGKIDRKGYGRVNNDEGKQVAAHRVGYELTKGVIPPGRVIDHLCRNHACVRPEHMRAVSPQVNVTENSVSLPAQNAQKTHCPRGHLYDAVHGSGSGYVSRVCRQCRAMQKRGQRDAKKAATADAF